MDVDTRNLEELVKRRQNLEKDHEEDRWMGLQDTWKEKNGKSSSEGCKAGPEEDMYVLKPV